MTQPSVHNHDQLRRKEIDQTDIAFKLSEQYGISTNYAASLVNRLINAKDWFPRYVDFIETEFSINLKPPVEYEKARQRRKERRRKRQELERMAA